MSDTMHTGSLPAGNDPIPAKAPVPPPAQDPEPIGYNWSLIVQWTAGAALSASVLGMEVMGYAPKGTFISLVAGPGLAALGIHSAAKNLN